MSVHSICKHIRDTQRASLNPCCRRSKDKRLGPTKQTPRRLRRVRVLPADGTHSPPQTAGAAARGRGLSCLRVLRNGSGVVMPWALHSRRLVQARSALTCLGWCSSFQRASRTGRNGGWLAPSNTHCVGDQRESHLSRRHRKQPHCPPPLRRQTLREGAFHPKSLRQHRWQLPTNPPSALARCRTQRPSKHVTYFFAAFSFRRSSSES